MTSVSIIIPSYGRSDKIVNAINSVLQQKTNAVVDVIVVDDNGLGTPNQLRTQSMIKNSFGNKVKYVPNETNIGAALSRNKGVELSEAKYISFLDDDDTYDINKTQCHIDTIGEHDVSLSGVLVKDTVNNHSYMRRAQNFDRDSFMSFILYGYCLTPMIFVKRSTFNDCGGFDVVNKFQDHILLLKLYEFGASFSQSLDSFFIHSYHINERITLNSSYYDALKIKQQAEIRIASNLNVNISDSNYLSFLHRRQWIQFYSTRNPFLAFSSFCLCLTKVRNLDMLSKLMLVLIPVKLKMKLLQHIKVDL